MILDLFKSEPKSRSALPRCQHHSPAGRQCSQPVCSTSPHFCFTHKPDPDQLLIAELTEAAGSLSTPEEIHNFLKKVTLLRVQGRLTPKESGNYTYLCQILQRGLREIAFHQKLRQERAEHEAEQSRINQVMSWSIPRPDRSGPSDTSPESSDIQDNDSTSISAAESARPSASSSESHSQIETNFVGAGLARPLLDVAHTETHTDAAHPAATVAESATEKTTPPQKSNQTPKTSAPPPARSTKHAKPSESSIPACSTTATAVLARPIATDSGPARRSRALSGEGGTSSTSCTPPDFYNHFHPIDPSIPPNLQDKNKNIPHPDAAECARLNARRGFPTSRLYRNASNRISTFWRH